MSDGIIQTHSGIAFDLRNPSVEMIDLDDIAHALANICRYNGHSSRFYSVAEHCAVGAMHMAGAHGRTVQRAFLLHDAAEAYIGDICRPLKYILGSEIKDLESGIQKIVHQRFGIGIFPSNTLHVIDEAMLAYEVGQLVPEPLVGEWPDFTDRPDIGVPLGLDPAAAKARFLGVATLLGVW